MSDTYHELTQASAELTHRTPYNDPDRVCETCQHWAARQSVKVPIRRALDRRELDHPLKRDMAPCLMAYDDDTRPEGDFRGEALVVTAAGGSCERHEYAPECLAYEGRA
jgi:hypothetical protein